MEKLVGTLVALGLFAGITLFLRVADPDGKLNDPWSLPLTMAFCTAIGFAVMLALRMVLDKLSELSPERVTRQSRR